MVDVRQMRQSTVLSLRAAVFVLAVFSKMYVRDTFSLRYSSKTQILLASVQMALSITDLVVYQACLYVVSGINEGAKYKSMPDDDEMEFELEDIEPADAAVPKDAPREIEVIVFASASALRVYVRRIHLTAVLVWGTFYSIDMGDYEVLDYFVAGLFLGWVAHLLCTRPLSQVRTVSMSSTMYVLLCLGILAVNQPALKPAPSATCWPCACCRWCLAGRGWCGSTRTRSWRTPRASSSRARCCAGSSRRRATGASCAGCWRATAWSLCFCWWSSRCSRASR